MDLVQLLRSQARKYRCPVCGESMADCEIALLVQAGNQALVRVTCTKCHDANLLKIIVQAGDAPEGETGLEPALDETQVDRLPPVGVDDVLDAKLALDAWDGDFRSLVAGTD